ncbi:hypothetical protein AQUCO_00300060v1 [Aquilegia coerulea]|uniref:Uncharacterized protein n=1 Tax=Aquilegia coerulea TaxID=218851 RepID=A0A2G5EX13_AQUCA|nr:hypothetical protein AQUCO_00300060v1 [Aquilegia coerulea]
MAEICSSGGLYYWRLEFNIVGQWAVTTTVDFSLAQLIQVIILLSTGGNNGGGYLASKYVVICFHGGILFLHALIYIVFPSLGYPFFGQLAALWNVVGTFVLMILIPTVATERASAKFVFTHFNTDNGDGIHSKPYIFLLGLFMSQYTLTELQVFHFVKPSTFVVVVTVMPWFCYCLLHALSTLIALMMLPSMFNGTEETKNADTNGPKGIIISAIGISIIVGWVTGTRVFYQAFKSRYGNGVGGIICLGVVALAIFFCGMSSVTSNSRWSHGAMPFSSYWHKVNKHEVPLNVVWFSVFISFCMALTSLWSLVAFQAMVSIATIIGLYIAYALPIFFRVTLARKSFVPGPFNLGRYGTDTLNYTPVAVGGLLIITVSWWIVSARHWFKGPITNLDS